MTTAFVQGVVVQDTTTQIIILKRDAKAFSEVRDGHGVDFVRDETRLFLDFGANTRIEVDPDSEMTLRLSPYITLGYAEKGRVSRMAQGLRFSSVANT